METAMKATKNLARELGLLRKRSITSTGTDKHKIQTPQAFTYLVVVDFESTCWEHDKSKTQEIIEFPAVLLNAQTGEIESEFHCYIQPQEYPTLSEFCRQLTGITQDQVDNGIPLNLCLRKFYRWLEQQQQEKGFCMLASGSNSNTETGVNVAAFVTWSDWDFGVCLHYELKRKQICKASWFNQWIDLRATYVKFYGRKPKGLNGALQDVGIEFEGREHSGLHDSRNTAKLVWRMVRDGCVLKITKSLSNALVVTSLHPVPLTAKAKMTSYTILTTPGQVRSTSKENSSSVMSPESVTCCHEPENSSTAVSMDSGFSAGVIPEHQGLVFDLKAPTRKGLAMKNVNTVGSKEIPSYIIGKKQTTKNHNNNSANSSKRKLDTPEKLFNILPADGRISHSCKMAKTEVASLTLVEEKKCEASSVGHGTTSKRATPDSGTPSCFQEEIVKRRTFSNVCLITAPIFKKPSPQGSNVSSATVSTPLSRRPGNLKTFQMCQTPVSQANSESSPSTQWTSPSLSRGSSQTAFMPTIKTATIKYSHGNQLLTTPTHNLSASFSRMKHTPPLCHCGRRAKRRVVQNPGPNVGRWFFSCGKGTTSLNNCRNISCSFFRWELSESCCRKTSLSPSRLDVDGVNLSNSPGGSSFPTGQHLPSSMFEKPGRSCSPKIHLR